MTEALKLPSSKCERKYKNRLWKMQSGWKRFSLKLHVYCKNIFLSFRLFNDRSKNLHFPLLVAMWVNSTKKLRRMLIKQLKRVEKSLLNHDAKFTWWLMLPRRGVNNRAEIFTQQINRKKASAHKFILQLQYVITYESQPKINTLSSRTSLS